MYNYNLYKDVQNIYLIDFNFAWKCESTLHLNIF